MSITLLHVSNGVIFLSVPVIAYDSILTPLYILAHQFL